MNDWFVSVINKFYFNVFGMLIQVLHKPKAIVIYMYLYPKKAVPVLNLLSDAFMAIWMPNTFGLHLKNHKLQINCFFAICIHVFNDVMVSFDILFQKEINIRQK